MPPSLETLRLLVYIYGFLLIISFFIFWLSSQIQTKVALTQKSITEGGVVLKWKGEEKKTISNLLSIGFYLLLFLGLLVSMYLIFRVFGNITIVLFGVIGLWITWDILEDFRLLSRFEFLRSRPWLYYPVKAAVTVPHRAYLGDRPFLVDLQSFWHFGWRLPHGRVHAQKIESPDDFHGCDCPF